MGAKPAARGLRRIAKAAGYSLAGLTAAWRGEAAFRQEVVLALVLIPAGAWLGATPAERALLVLSVLLVPVVELINSAIEAVVDRFGGARHELSGQAKDLGSAAVFLSLLGLVAVWALVLGPRFL